jgi:hypothetical protein
VPKGENTPATYSKKVSIQPSQLEVIDSFRKLPPVRKNDAKAVRERLDYYFRTCQENEIFPSISSLSLCCGVSRQSILKWGNDSTSETGQLIQRAKSAIDTCLTQGSLSGSIPFIYAIFQQKANFQYRDKDEPMQELPTNAEDAAAIEDKVNQSGLVWDETIGDYVIDGGGADD